MKIRYERGGKAVADKVPDELTQNILAGAFNLKIFLKFLYGNRPTDMAKPQQNSEYLTEIDKMLKCVFNGVTECFILCKAFFPCCVKSSLKFKKGLNHVFIFLLIHNNALSSSPDVWTNGLPQWLKGIDPRKEQVHSLKVFNTISIHKHRETL